MPNINIAGKEYDFDSLPKEAKDQLGSLQFVNGELQRVNAQLAVLMTARSAYTKALEDILHKASDAPKSSVPT